MNDSGYWNVKGILDNAKKAGRSFKKAPNYQPKGKAKALADKIKKQK